MKTPKQSERLQPLQHRAGQREEAAARQLLDQQRQLAERETRLHELQQYLQEYETAAALPTASAMLNRHAFVQRLREAISVQAQLVEQARQACDLGRARWFDQRREVSTLDQLADCYRRREHRADERKAQKHLDEFALRAYVAAHAGSEDGASE